MSRLSSPLLLLAVASLQSVLPIVTGLRIYKERADVFNMLGGGDTGEERLYLEHCSQSSSTGNCVLAMDEDVINEWTQCASTEREAFGWWKALLEAPAYITRVVLHTMDMPDTDMERALTDFALMAGEITCFRHMSNEQFKNKSLPCDALADQLTIQSYRRNAILSLCEIEVYGKPVTFQGLETGQMELDFETCEQSSTYGENDCINALDRLFVHYPSNYNKVCAQTNPEDGPWWAVYFTTPSLVKQVKVYNRLDCCAEGQSEFEIKVNGVMCAKHKDANQFATKIFKCERFGSNLRVQSLRNEKLSLCQVQVFGHKMILLADTIHNYLGCYKDNPEDPDLEMLISGTWMSPRKCHRMCKRQNKIFFGLQNGQACMCGNKYGKHGKLDEADCNMACKDAKKMACGGRNANTIYEIIM